MTAATATTVLCCGDRLRADDAVALLAVGGLSPQAREACTIERRGTLEVEDLVDLPSGARVVIVDAVVGRNPGEVVSFDLAALDAQATHIVARSSHQLPLDRVVALAQLLRIEPLQGAFVGLGIEDVTVGEAAGAKVLAALPRFRSAIEQAILAVDSAARVGQRTSR